MSEGALTTTPYKGLMPYSEEDAPFFFGRDLEREILIANLMTSRLTLFYGPSGVGKSSVLRAGVAHHLRRLARENLDETGSPQFAIVVFNSWRFDPIEALEAKVRQSAMLSLDSQKTAPVESSRSLPDVFKAWTERLGGELLIILDQFEEYFLYHSRAEGADTFAAQFPRMVNSDISVNFLISIRADGLAKLDHFQGKIPTLFDNRLGIDHLDRSAARDAIIQPIEQFNRLYAAGRRRVGIEPDLVESVLDQVKTGEVTVGEAGRGVIKKQNGDARIETPYLQLVMTRLWNEDVSSGSYTLQLKTLKALGGAKRIVRTHLDAAMKALPDADQNVAARVFHYLVTPSGTKIAHTASDLAQYSELPEEKVQPVLERLSGADLRILRGVAPPPDKADEQRYEIFHDVLGAAILDWRRRHALERQRRKEEAEQKKRIAGFRTGVAALFLLAVAALIYIAVGKNRESRLEKKAQSQQQAITKAKERSQLDELALQYKDQPRYEKPIAQLIGLTSDNAEDRSLALESLRALASNGQLPSDLVPVVIETVKSNEPSRADETRTHIEEAMKAAPPDDPVPEVDKPTHRVFVHIRDDQPQQRAQAALVRKRLEDIGLVVPKFERVSSGPLNNELRYFRNDEADEVGDIISNLKDLNIGNIQARYVRGYEKSAVVRPYQYELWFGAPKKDSPDSPAQVQYPESQQGPPEVAGLQVYVTDGSTQQPAAGAAVFVKSSNNKFAMTVTTNASGLAAFKDVPTGPALIRVIKSGFAAYAAESQIGRTNEPPKRSVITRVNITLSRTGSKSPRS